MFPINRSMKYNSKIDRGTIILALFSILCCVVGPAIVGEVIPAIILGLAVVLFEIVIFISLKYEIRGNQLGIRTFFRWNWYPIDKISTITRRQSIISAPALAYDRLAIKFSDKKILRSSMPLEISPDDFNRFISEIKDVNPDVIVKL